MCHLDSVRWEGTLLTHLTSPQIILVLASYFFFLLPLSFTAPRDGYVSLESDSAKLFIFLSTPEFTFIMKHFNTRSWLIFGQLDRYIYTYIIFCTLYIIYYKLTIKGKVYYLKSHMNYSSCSPQNVPSLELRK